LPTALANAEDSARNDHRRDLAEFFLAHDMGAESRAYLSLMREDNADLASEPAFLALRGIAHLQIGRYEAAREDLSHEGLDGEPQIALWRARAAAALEAWRAVREHYHAGVEALPNYEETRRARFQLASLRAALGQGNLDAAEREVRVLTSYDLPKPLATRVTLLQGRLFAEQARNDRALTAFDNVIAADYRPTRVRAELSRVQTLLDEDAISREEAITELERLRYVWRGDKVELTALRLLGDLYVEGQNYRKALSRMRTAVTHFTDRPAARAVTRRMGEVFRSLFLDGKAQEMTPLRALALYYDFQELTPVGYEGPSDRVPFSESTDGLATQLRTLLREDISHEPVSVPTATDTVAQYLELYDLGPADSDSTVTSSDVSTVGS
jgi:tetratricopeptide (TPR) repeat protein